MKNRSLRAQRLVPALSALSAALVVTHVPVQAAEMDPVVISAARVAQPLSTVLPSVSVITREDIDRSQATTLADLLQGEAGFEFGRNGGPGTVTSFFLRGQDSVNMVLMVDGVRSQTDSIGSLQVTDIPLGMVERVEILRGNASALYGEAAIGGVIQITTRHSQGTPKSYASMTAGSYGTVEAQTGYGGKNGEYSFDINAGAANSQGFSAMNTVQKVRANPDKDGYSRQFLSARLERRLDADLSVGVRVNSRRSRVDYDDTTGVTDTHRFKQSNDTLGVFARKALSADWISSLDIAATELSYDDLKNGVPYTAGDGSWKNGHMTGQQQVVRWSNEYQMANGRQVVFGLEHNDEKFKAEGDNAYNMKRNTKAGFAGLTQKLDQWTLQLNIRHDEVTVDNADAWSSSNNVSRATTGLLGAGYSLTPNWRLTATTSTGFRAPTAYDISQNAQLKMETHRGYEAGVTYAEGATQGRVVMFTTSSHDAIGYDSNFNVMNIGDTRNQGLEASLRTYWQGYVIKANAVAQDPWSVTYSERLARRAREYASLDVSRPVAAYDVGVKVMAVGSRKDSHYTSNMLGGYALWSFYASHKLDENWTARVKLENAFDKQYQLAYGYNTPGRGIYASLQYSPK